MDGVTEVLVVVSTVAAAAVAAAANLRLSEPGRDAGRDKGGLFVDFGGGGSIEKASAVR